MVFDINSTKESTEMHHKLTTSGAQFRNRTLQNFLADQCQKATARKS